jgi:DNA-binding transcriptional MerR regulator
MAKAEQQKEARRLRTEGMSIKDISRILRVSKSSVSLWCRNIELTIGQIQKLHEKMVVGGYAGRMKGAHAQRERKEARIECHYQEARKEIIQLKNRELFLAGLGLYWGEGGKVNAGGVRMFNSDPLVVKFMMRWFREVFKISNDRFYMNITINQIHEDRLKDVVKYWSKVTAVPLNQFRKPVLIRVKNKKIYENHFEHHGTLCIRMTKSTDLLYKIKGLLRALSEAG